MKKTFCDICEREIVPTSVGVIRDFENVNIIIERKGHDLDICGVCRNKLLRYAFNEAIKEEENNELQS